MTRQEVYKALYDFVVVMKEKLDENKSKGGWDSVDTSWLWMRLQKEMSELYSALNSSEPNPEEMVRECADVANFAMMIADRVMNEHAHDGGGPRGSEGAGADGKEEGDSEGEASS